MMFRPSASHFLRGASSPFIESWSSNEVRGEPTDPASTFRASAYGNCRPGDVHRDASGCAVFPSLNCQFSLDALHPYVGL